jgi:hypothetical protein
LTSKSIRQIHYIHVHFRTWEDNIYAIWNFAERLLSKTLILRTKFEILHKMNYGFLQDREHLAMNENILKEIDALRQKIDSGSFLNSPKQQNEWGGADVVIRDQLNENISKWLGNQNIILSFQKDEPRRRAVITEFSKELSWTFRQLRDIFKEDLDYISKYDFYGSLAQAAIDYLECSKEKAECKKLLQTVLDAAGNYKFLWFRK